jgi:hypothetical protein
MLDVLIEGCALRVDVALVRISGLTIPLWCPTSWRTSLLPPDGDDPLRTRVSNDLRVLGQTTTDHLLQTLDHGGSDVVTS